MYMIIGKKSTQCKDAELRLKPPEAGRFSAHDKHLCEHPKRTNVYVRKMALITYKYELKTNLWVNFKELFCKLKELSKISYFFGYTFRITDDIQLFYKNVCK